MRVEGLEKGIYIQEEVLYTIDRDTLQVVIFMKIKIAAGTSMILAILAICRPIPDGS